MNEKRSETSSRTCKSSRLLLAAILLLLLQAACGGRTEEAPAAVAPDQRYSQAADQLRRMIAINADSYDAHTALARMLKELGDEAGAADALSRAVYIYPYNPALHEELAALHEEIGDWPMAVRARESVLALAPIDLAEAHYRLAYAHGRAGDRPAARYQVLRALERAPSYPEALELLLELHGEGDAARRASD